MGTPLTGRRLSIYYSSAPPGFFVREARFANRQFVSHSFFVPPDFPLYSLLRSQRDPGLHFLCREKVTKSGRGRGSPRWHAISFALRAMEIEIPPGGLSGPEREKRPGGTFQLTFPTEGRDGGTWGDWSPREGRPAPKGRAFRRRPSALGGVSPARPLFAAESGLPLPPG